MSPYTSASPQPTPASSSKNYRLMALNALHHVLMATLALAIGVAVYNYPARMVGTFLGSAFSTWAMVTYYTNKGKQ